MVVRMAVLYDLLAGPPAAGEPAEPIGAAVAGLMAARLVQRPGPAASVVMRGARVLDPAAGIDEVRDLVVRDGVVGGAADGLRGDRRRGPGRGARASSTPTCTCARRAARTSRTSPPAPPPPPRAASWPSWRCPTPRRSSTRPRCSARCSSAASRRRAVRVGFLAAITAGQKGAELTEQVELAGARRRRLQRRRPPGGRRRRHAPRAPVPAHHRPAAGAARGGPGACRGAGSCTRAPVGQPAGPGGHPVDLRERRRRARRGAGRVRGRARSTSATSRPRRPSRRSAAPRRAACASRPRSRPHHLVLTDAAVDSLDPSRHKMNPPLRERVRPRRR